MSALDDAPDADVPDADVPDDAEEEEPDRPPPDVGACRLFLVALAIIAGAGWALVAPAPGLALAAAGVSLAACIAVPRHLVLLLAAASLGWCCGSLRIASLDLGGFDPDPLQTITGVIVQPPRIYPEDIYATVRIEEPHTLAGHRLTIVVRSPPWREGPAAFALDLADRIRIEDARLTDVRIESFRSAVRRYRDRIAGRIYADPDEIELLGTGGGPLVRVARTGRSWVREAADVLPGQSGALLRGIAIGDTSQLSPAVQEDFRRTGLTHFVAVSGANVAVLLAAVALLLRALRAPVALIPWILGAVVVSFCAISAFAPSVVRASVMALLVVLAYAMGASRSALRLLSATVVVLAIADPFIAFELGFQLSVVATFGLLTVGRALGERVTERPLLAMLAISAGAQVATMPVLAIATGRVSLISLPANLAAASFRPPAMIVAFVSSTLTEVVPGARYLAWLAYPFLVIMLGLARVLSDLPLAVVSVPGGVLGMVVIGALVLLAIVALMRGRRSAAFVIGLVVLVPLAIGFALVSRAPPPLAGLTITMLDIGQGESILISEGQHTMLIDGGKDRESVARMLRDRGVFRLDYLVVSHAHSDHIAGLVTVAERTSIGAILDPGFESSLGDYHELTELSAQRDIPWVTARAGQTYELGEATVTILWPPEEFLTGTDSDINENSIVFRIDMGSDSMLYTGETQEEAQKALLELDPSALKVDILKVSHHGSKRMSPDFYRATEAKYALIPVGPNTYGHPAPETLIALHGMEILRSDTHGHVAVTMSGFDQIAVRTER